MSIRQDIYNESDNYSSVIVTTKYYVEPDENSLWNHREIEYNDAGVPILKLYVGETKKVYKRVFINGVEQDVDLLKAIIPFEYYGETNYREDGITEMDVVINGAGIGDYVLVHGENIGSVKLPNNLTGELPSNYVNVNNPELLVIVEKEPAIVGLKWGHENPLILTSREDVELSIKTIFNNGQEYEINTNALEQLHIVSSNPHAAYIECNYQNDNVDENQVNMLNKYIIHPNNLDDRCQVHITADSLKKTFGEDINTIEPLTIITSKDIDPEMLLSAKFYVEYEKEIPLIDINKTYNISIYGIYELSDGKKLTYNIDDVYTFISANSEIVNTNYTNNTLYPKSLGTTQITATCDKADSTFSVIPDKIMWDVRIIKSLTSIDWNIDKTKLNIGVDYATLTVNANYTDNTHEDISSSCSFEYDDTLIKIDGNKIIPISPGTTTITVLSSFETGDITSVKSYELTIIQPMERIEIIDSEKTVLNNTELEWYVGDEKDLTYILYPTNATPQSMIWTSTDESVVSVDKNGHVKVLKEGHADIFVSIQTTEIKINSDEDATEENTNQLYSSIYATCSINALIISVTNITLSHKEVELYVGDKEFEYTVSVEPKEASNKDVTVTFKSDNREWPITYHPTNYTIIPNKAGSGTIIVTSVSNPEIYTEMKVIVVDNRVKKVIIDEGNDTDYEYYDDFVNSPEVDAYKNDENITIGGQSYTIDKIEKHERWDDNDFPRYYCPINNSLQLTANVEPNGASFSDLIWYSSDGELVKCTENGIVTPVRYGKQTLDMDGLDNVNDEGRRFPNTTWVTAYNKKGKVAGVCQIRVTKNNITGIAIGEPESHDYDEDVYDKDGYLADEYYGKHDSYYDYVLWRGEEVILPVTLSVQDPNFGPSNNIEWYGSIRHGNSDFSWSEICELNNETVNHENENLDFDWTNTTPQTINDAKKNLNVILKGVGIGAVEFYAQVENNEQYYAPVNTATAITGSNEGWNDVGKCELVDYKIQVIYLGDKYQAMIDGCIVTLNANKQIHITVPATFTVTNDGKQQECYVSKNWSNDCNRIEVKVLDKDEEPVEGMTILVEAYSSASRITQSLSKTDSNGVVTCPSMNNDDKINMTSGYMINNARPGEGVWTDVEKSTKVRVKVVDSPSDIYVTFKSLSRVINRDLDTHNLSPVWSPNTRVKIKNSSKRCVPCFIYFDEEFVDLLNEYADNGECPLDDKYMSFAWFTSDPNVFIPIERSQVNNKEKDAPDVDEKFYGNPVTKREFNLKGYGRYMCIQPTGVGKATLTIVNIMSGKTWERLIEVVD